MSEDNGKIYMYVTDDKYELPLFFASTIKGLSEIMGVTQNAISSALSHAKEGRKSRYICVDLKKNV